MDFHALQHDQALLQIVGIPGQIPAQLRAFHDHVLKPLIDPLKGLVGGHDHQGRGRVLGDGVTQHIIGALGFGGLHAGHDGNALHHGIIEGVHRSHGIGHQVVVPQARDGGLLRQDPVLLGPLADGDILRGGPGGPLGGRPRNGKAHFHSFKFSFPRRFPFGFSKSLIRHLAPLPERHYRHRRCFPATAG